MEIDLGRVLEALPAMVWTALPDGRIDYVNRRWSEYTGLALDEAHGSEWQAAVHQDDLQTLVESWRSILAAGESDALEARLRRRDGQYRWFLIQCNPMRDEHGGIAKWCGVATEVEDFRHAQRRAEDALGEARSELAHMTRITSLGALTASIAHEVSQPLSGIITNAGTCLRMLAADPPNLEGARETARRTIRDGNRAADVITRLRALFSKRASAIEAVDLNEAAREVIALSWSDLQRSRVVMRTELADALPLVAGNRVQLQQVIMNLLRNASDAMNSVDDRPRRLVIRTEPEQDDRVRLTVQDAGVGFANDGAARLFEAFYTTKSEGMGIGLSVSRSIIESHNGRLWAAANDGPGVTFAFSIPAYSGAEASSSGRDSHANVGSNVQNAAGIS